MNVDQISAQTDFDHRADSRIIKTATTQRAQEVEAAFGSQELLFRRVFYPLGFALDLETNREAILDAAQESWGEQSLLPTPGKHVPSIKLRLTVAESAASECPPAARYHANGHLLSIIADAENCIVCDLQQGFAFGWMTEAAMRHRAYLRYHFLEAAALCLLTGSRVTPIHAACVSRNGRGFLLCGASGAGKSTLAYACARAGFTYTTDDASYVVWDDNCARVRGNAHQVRFRPSARELFTELAGRGLTPRTEGKPSIEVRTAELPGITTAAEATVNILVLLDREADVAAELRRLPASEMLPYLQSTLYPLEGIRERQAVALACLYNLEMYTLRYGDLTGAIALLESLTREKTK